MAVAILYIFCMVYNTRTPSGIGLHQSNGLRTAGNFVLSTSSSRCLALRTCLGTPLFYPVNDIGVVCRPLCLRSTCIPHDRPGPTPQRVIVGD